MPDIIRHHHLHRVSLLNGALPLSLAVLSACLLVGTFTLKRLSKWYKRWRREKLAKVPTFGFGEPTGDGLPAVIIETGQEHDENDSHDAMLEAENTVIRESVKRQGIVWPEAFRALGLLKEKEDHHRKPNLRKSKYLQVPEDGHDHASDSWIQWWKAGQRDMRRVSRWKAKIKRITTKQVAKQLVKKGKRDFVQGLTAWAVVALLYINAFDAATGDAWAYTPSAAWVSYHRPRLQL